MSVGGIQSHTALDMHHIVYSVCTRRDNTNINWTKHLFAYCDVIALRPTQGACGTKYLPV
jgi:hypothetical protein